MLEIIRSLPEYRAIVDSLTGSQPITGLRLQRSARLSLIASLQIDLNQPILVITDRTDRALKMLDELVFWDSQIKLFPFPEPNPLFYEEAAWGVGTRRERLQALTELAINHIPGARRSQQSLVIVAPVRAVMTRTLPRRDFLKACRILKVGDKVSMESLQRTWVEIGYEAADIVIETGQFSRRGGILDVWTPSESAPVRIEFFGDEIDTLRRFDPATQRTVESIEKTLVTPAREVLPGKAWSRLPEGKEIDEFYLPLVHSTNASILDYLPEKSLVLMDDLDILQTTSDEIEQQAISLRKDSIEQGILPPDFPIPYVSMSELIESLNNRTWFDLGGYEQDEGSLLAQRFAPCPRFGGQLKPFIDFLYECSNKNDQVIVVSRQVSRLQELWNEKTATLEPQKPPIFEEVSLSDGWALSLLDGSFLYLLTDSEIFGWERPKPRKRVRHFNESPETFYTDLKLDDWVVHIDYGIGQYKGLVHRTLDGIEREFLMVEYEGGDQLYVPVYQADRLTRYIGPNGETPNSTRLGTPEWSNTKKKVSESTQEVARDLLELYARRQMAQGFSFGKDTTWQTELEASFPYSETEDQIKAIVDVKKDMENKRPMDRLLCGDVGYGKTEVALRAAFKAVMDGKQVAVLVPTTVLAQQHYETFCHRLAPFPVQVEMLSRFRTHKEQSKIVARLRIGQVDIVIGTHRLLQQDVIFKDLGLVIIDEEQRFGVAHKEYFKRLRAEVDVLTLTATPIPRTLYMALTGVRDISSINTPPEERLPVITHIGPYSPRLVRQAILRELERRGQIFFVHNRVQTIRAMQAHLENLVPEARIGVGHGQMPENELAAVMDRFRQGEIDILLCTSIIESGLDIPNANTLIVDRGDTFGLAQLYQLRGRVGRSAQRAYAYFFRHRRKPPTPEGLERLETIAENTQLGSGYSIAMRDLEMRGAGELLGNSQHGFIAAVGFHLYTRLLAQSVRSMQQTHETKPLIAQETTFRELVLPVSVDLPLSIGIPVDYVPDHNLRLRLYRRLAELQKDDEIKTMADEFTDRFGTLPESIENLFYQMKVKIRAEMAGLTSIALEGNQIVLHYPTLPEGIQTRNLPEIGFQTRAGKNAYRMQVNEDWREDLLKVLSAIIKIFSPIKLEIGQME